MSSLKGKIKNESGLPLNATIIVKGTKYYTHTNDDGEFSFELPLGKYDLEIVSVGYHKEHQAVDVSQGNQVLAKDIILYNDKKLDSVNITSKSTIKRVKEQPFLMNVLDTKKLYNTSSDLNHALNQTSGIRVREQGGVGSDFSFTLNGFSGKQIRFFLDGIPMDNFGSSLTLNNFPVNMAERVEIYKGVVPVSLGSDALGGAVNVITRSNPNYLDASYGYGSFNTHKASVNYAKTDLKTGFTLRANAFYIYSDNDYKVKVQPIDLVTGQKETEREIKRFHDAYESKGAIVELGVTGKKYADKLLVGIIGSENKKDIQNGVTMDQVFGARKSTSNSIIPTIKYKKNDLFIKGLDANIYGLYNITNNKFIDTTRLRYNWLQETIPTSTAEVSRTQLKNKDKNAVLSANLNYRINNHQTLSYNYIMTSFSRKSSDVENPDNVTFLYPQKLTKQIMGLGWDAKYDRLSATVFGKYYMLNAKSFEQISDGTGVASYQHSSTNTTNFGYGSAISYFLFSALQVKLSYEHTYRLPEAIEFLGDGLFVRRNSALKPEKSDNVNVGALYSWIINDKNKLNFEGNYIFRKSKDFIRLDQQQNQPIDRQYVNIGDALTNGVEGEIRYLWNNKLHSTLNVTYQNIIDKQKTISSTNFQGTTTTPNYNYGYKLPNIPYLFGNFDLGYLFDKVGNEKNKLDISYSLNFTQKYYLTPHQLGQNNEDDIPRQIAHNIMATYTINNGRYNISFECNNLTNSDLFDNYLLQKPGRSFFLKLRYFIPY